MISLAFQRGAVSPWRALMVGLTAATLLLTSLPLVLAAPACPEAPALGAMHLPHLRQAVVTSTQAVIVTLGSSSTAGAKASNLAHSYPAELQAALGMAWPEEHVAVINRGISGQDAPEELARMPADVIAIHPQLVIWQVGANGALRDADPSVFGRMVTEGVRRLKASGSDVILMDNQRAPRILKASDHAAVEAALRGVAETTGVNLFSRGLLMDGWRRGGAPLAQFISADGLHHNDLGYRCVALALAEEITAAVHATAPITASR
jgi:lysophospholipase L1-like esterase